MDKPLCRVEREAMDFKVFTMNSVHRPKVSTARGMNTPPAAKTDASYLASS